jgi:hypothetical protein
MRLGSILNMVKTEIFINSYCPVQSLRRAILEKSATSSRLMCVVLISVMN